jgi:hypothetical protein
MAPVVVVSAHVSIHQYACSDVSGSSSCYNNKVLWNTVNPAERKLHIQASSVGGCLYASPGLYMP